MTTTIDSIRAEFLRHKALAEGAIAQVAEADLSAQRFANDNSIATICWHISGNFESRFADFLTSDGEKPWRHREEEFEPRPVEKPELLAKWSRGWDVMLKALSELGDEDLHRTVAIRGQSLQVNEALHRSLAHVAYHVGQIVFIGKSLQRENWSFLSIPPGQSDAYNRAPDKERAPREPERSGAPAPASVIRPFAESDRRAVVALWTEAFPNDPPHNVSDAMIDIKMRVQPELFLVATVDGIVVGTVMAGFDGVRGWLHRLAVGSTARRLGIATQLVRSAEAGLAAMGCPKVNLQVRATNRDVVAFYETVGYAVEDNLSLARRL